MQKDILNKENSNTPLVSVIIPTKNSQKYLEKCLKSVKNQTFQNFEIIVVDNFSTDKTEEIARKYTNNFFQKGPERSAQVNFGVLKAAGKYVYKVDSDFLLDSRVLEQAVNKIKNGFDAIMVHNSLDESVSFLAKIRNFEVSMYKYDKTHCSARFVKKEVYQKIGGFNSKITAGEDYDFQTKLDKNGFKIGFIEAEALHLDEPKNSQFFKLMKKYFNYGVDSNNYLKSNQDQINKQLFRFIYFKHFKKMLRHPILTICFVFYMFNKFLFGGMGFLYGKIKLNKNKLQENHVSH
jgi:glycosyltransferase involved in cell wall biosynthesis